MSKANSFAEKYPYLNRFVEEQGWIEIGDSEYVNSFVRAYDLGGTVYHGKSSYPSMEAAFQDLEEHIQAYFEDLGI
jgi:exodeoxyribonuclease V alpha subunit